MAPGSDPFSYLDPPKGPQGNHVVDPFAYLGPMPERASAAQLTTYIPGVGQMFAPPEQAGPPTVGQAMAAMHRSPSWLANMQAAAPGSEEEARIAAGTPYIQQVPAYRNVAGVPMPAHTNIIPPERVGRLYSPSASDEISSQAHHIIETTPEQSGFDWLGQIASRTSEALVSPGEKGENWGTGMLRGGVRTALTLGNPLSALSFAGNLASSKDYPGQGMVEGAGGLLTAAGHAVHTLATASVFDNKPDGTPFVRPATPEEYGEAAVVGAGFFMGGGKGIVEHIAGKVRAGEITPAQGAAAVTEYTRPPGSRYGFQTEAGGRQAGEPAPPGARLEPTGPRALEAASVDPLAGYHYVPPHQIPFDRFSQQGFERYKSNALADVAGMQELKDAGLDKTTTRRMAWAQGQAAALAKATEIPGWLETKLRNQHQTLIQQALDAGEHVPQNVLDTHPGVFDDVKQSVSEAESGGVHKEVQPASGPVGDGTSQTDVRSEAGNEGGLPDTERRGTSVVAEQHGGAESGSGDAVAGHEPNGGNAAVDGGNASVTHPALERLLDTFKEAGTFRDGTALASARDLWQRIASQWAQEQMGRRVGDFYKGVKGVLDSARTEGHLRQVEGIHTGTEDHPVFSGKDAFKEAAKWLDEFARKNPVFKGDLKDISSEEISKSLTEHIQRELEAWQNVSKAAKPSFTSDIEVTNQNLQQVARRDYGRELTPAEVKLYHLVSSLASPRTAPIVEGSFGFRIFDRFMRTGKLNALENGKLISGTYAKTALDRVKMLIEKKGLDGAMDWLGSRQSYDDIKETFGMKRLKPHEYLNRTEGGFGMFGIGDVPKLGSYALNRWGEMGTITKDMWVARTMARYSGELIRDGKVVCRPWGTTAEGIRLRKALDVAFEQVAKERGMTPAEVQQSLWDAEHMLYNKLGASQKATYASEGLERGVEKAKSAAEKAWYDIKTRTFGAITGASDFSSFIHESFHDWSRPGFLADKYVNLLEEHFGERGSTAYYEGSARAFERYLRDGEAPVPELKGLFESIKAEMVRIYSRLKGTPIEKAVHPEVRAVFDQMLGKKQASSFSAPGT